MTVCTQCGAPVPPRFGHGQTYQAKTCSPECRKKHRAATIKKYNAARRVERAQLMRLYYQRHPERLRIVIERTNFAKFGLRRSDYDAMLLAQRGACAVCGTETPGGRGRFHIDHDHRFNKRDPRGHRGLLCNNCNMGLGRFKDDAKRLRAAAQYVEAFNERAAVRLVAVGT